MVVRTRSRFNRARIGLAARWPQRFKVGRFLRDARGGATTIVACAVAVMAVCGVAFIVDHIWLVDQRDVLRGASKSAAFAATMEMNRLPAATPDDELREKLQKTAESYALLNLMYLPEDKLTHAKETLTVEVSPDRATSKVGVVASADLGGTLFARHLPALGSYTGPEKIAAGSGVGEPRQPG